jgi:EAL domain-containing protein (putative c-di-GMP-specific phosphodiesterase class I)
MRFLANHRCDEIQGFWLSQPLEAHACLAFIRHWSPDRLLGAPSAAAAP